MTSSTETPPDTSTSLSTAAADLRVAQCGGTQVPGWRLGWAQVVGVHHPRYTEDSLAHASRPPAGGGEGAAQPLWLAVADGVGGGSHSEIAAAALVHHCTDMPHELLGHADAMARWMSLAEAQVQLKLREVSLAPGAATLAAAWLAAPDGPAAEAQGHLLRVGDARLYRFDGRQVQALTQDQTYTAVGEPLPSGATPDDPARMVGTGYMGEPELVPLQLAAGHTLVLCSDGLHRGLEPEPMAALLHDCADLELAAWRLAAAARQNGSEDDITVLLAQPDTSAVRARDTAAGLYGAVRGWLGLGSPPAA